jgi:IS30 family transposase
MLRPISASILKTEFISNLISISKNNATYKSRVVVERESVMSGVLKIEISESEETLKELLTQQKKTKLQQRVQVLYWLKTKQAETVEHLATLVGRHRTTVSRWLSEYRAGTVHFFIGSLLPRLLPKIS